MKRINAYSFIILAMLAVFVVECPAAPQKDVQIRVMAFSRVGDVREMLIAGANGKLLDQKPMKLPTTQLSEVKEVSTRTLQFLAAPGGSGKNGEDLKAEQLQKLGEVVLPNVGDEYCLVFIPNKAGADSPYIVHALPISKQNFGSGDQAFVNYCKTDLAFLMGEAKIEVRSGKVGIYRPKKIEGKHTIVGYEKGVKGNWNRTPFYSSRMIVQKGVRNLIFIVPDPTTGRPEFRSVSDFVEQ